MKNNHKSLYGVSLVACAAAFLGVNYTAMTPMDWIVLPLAGLAALFVIVHFVRNRKG